MYTWSNIQKKKWGHHAQEFSQPMLLQYNLLGSAVGID
jgi:hypothetical protein